MYTIIYLSAEKKFIEKGCSMKVTVKLIDCGGEFIANCPELDINCYGSNRDEATRRIRSVINFYVESAKEFGLDVINLKEISIEGSQKAQDAWCGATAVSGTLN